MEQIQKEKARRARNSLVKFLQLSNHGAWNRACHLDLLCQKLEEVEAGVRAGKSPRLIITMPPRHGKSEVTSKGYPAWILGRNPGWEIILTSYAAEIATDFSRISREKIREFGPSVFNVKLSQETAAVNRWGLEGYRGGLNAVGAGGPLTGRGAHIAIIDDPFKGPEDSGSPTQRKKVIDWYKSVLRTRLAPGGAVILIQTRWHKDDLAGWLLSQMENGGEQWEILNLPALAEENDPLGRDLNEPLWPERFSREELLKIKSLDLYFWNALYQQHPGDPEGGLFKRQYFRYFEKEGEWFILHSPEGEKRWSDSRCTVFQTCDPAGSTKEKADYFVLSTWAATPHNELLLLDVIRDKLEGPDQPELFQSGYDRWHPIAQGVESKNMGLTLFQTLQRTSLPVEELRPDGDKVLRARPMAARYKSGMVYHRKHAAWLDEWEEELIGFPNAAHDDQVDCAAYAYVMLQDIELYQKSEYREGDFT